MFKVTLRLSSSAHNNDKHDNNELENYSTVVQIDITRADYNSMSAIVSDLEEFLSKIA